MTPSTHDAAPTNPAVVMVALSALALAFLTYLFTDNRVDENLRALGVLLLALILVFPQRLGRRWFTWAGVFAVMLAGFVMRPLDVPNHHVMLTYVAAAAALALTAKPEDHEPLLRANARWFIVALMSLATLHRLLSADFLNGSYVAFESARGGFLTPLLPLWGDAEAVAAANDAAIDAFRATPPDAAESVTLTPLTPSPTLVTFVFAAAMLAIEAWVALVMWRFPHRLIAHLSVWFFVASLSVIRQEMTFITVLCAVGLLSCPPTLPKIRLGYAVLTTFAAASVLKTLNVV